MYYGVKPKEMLRIKRQVKGTNASLKTLKRRQIRRVSDDLGSRSKVLLHKEKMILRHGYNIGQRNLQKTPRGRAHLSSKSVIYTDAGP